MSFTVPAIFFDGESNRRRDVELRFVDSLEIREDGRSLTSWPFADIRVVDAPASLMRLCCVAGPPLARLELRDPIAQRRIEQYCAALKGPGGAQPIAAGRIAAWSIAATAVIVAMIWYGVPLMADRLTDALPIAWERPLGQAVDRQVRAIFSGAACTKPAGQAALTKLVASLQAAAHLPIEPDPIVLRSSVPNAFALPGGRVYILSGLLDRAVSPDELGGVLAHEFGHIHHRDGVRRLIRDGSTGFLIDLLFGDVSGAGAGLLAARSLLSAAYSRDLEAGADAFAVTTMQRLGRPTAPLGALLLRIAGPGEEPLSILLDHPLTPERARRLAEVESAPSGPPLLDETEWEALRAICTAVTPSGPD